MLASVFALGLAFLPSAFAYVHNVQVGAEGKLLYSPEAIFAEPGDQVVFHFHAPSNHSVTESSFADPCGRKEGGLSSGFQPVAANVSIEALPTYTIDVKDKTPTWIYCGQARGLPNSHCGAGMVFAINCGPDDAPNSFANFKHSALAVGERLKAEAAAASQASPAAPAYTTAAYGGVTIPAAPIPTLVTQVISLEAAVWTTTYSSYPGSPAATPATLEGRVHKVIVGGPNGLVFDPPSIEALPRDTIVFEFRAKNHTVTQSSFEDPCRPRPNGFDSSFQFVAADATEFPTWNYTVQDTAPVWVYCRQANHCGQGMVGAINPEKGSGRTFEAFQNVAKALNGTTASSTNNETTPDAADDGSASSLATGAKFALSTVLGLVLVALL